jgi:glycosyltransferase involved in cell wall biosynthesis
MNILAVIPCLNEEVNIERLVQHLVRESATCPMSIVIADGGSSDKTVEIAQKLAAAHSNVVYLHNPGRLQSAAVNLAVATYGKDTEYLIRLDAHADYPEHYCQTLVEEVKLTKADSVVVAMNTVGKGGFQSAVAAAQNSKLGNGGSAHRLAATEGAWVDHGHHALMRIEAFNTTHGYDEHFSHNEDAELDVRLGKAGFKIWLTAKTSITYYPRAAPLPLLKQYISYGRGRVRTLMKHHVHPKLRQVLPAAVLPAFILMFIAPHSYLLHLPFKLWVLLCLGYGILLAVKAKDITIALAGPAAMIMHFGWSVGFWRELVETLWKRVN